jgi:hypothetical protein
MRSLLNGFCRLSLISLMAFCLPVFAEDSKPQEQPVPPAAPSEPEAGKTQQQPVPAATPAEETSPSPKNIWQEVSFEADQEFDLDGPRVQQLLEEIKRTDPSKAEILERLRNEDPKKFIEELRLEFKTALQPKAKPADSPAEQTPKAASEWQEQLQRRYDSFMEWFAKEYSSEHAELLKLRESDAEKYVQRVMDMMTIYEPIQRAQRYNPPLADVMKKDIELQKQRDALLLRIRTAGADEQPQLLKELETLVSTRFDIIVQKKELQYESLRKRLERLEQQLDQQAMELENLKKNKTQTVEDHIKDLMSRTEKITW